MNPPVLEGEVYYIELNEAPSADEIAAINSFRKSHHTIITPVGPWDDDEGMIHEIIKPTPLDQLKCIDFLTDYLVVAVDCSDYSHGYDVKKLWYSYGSTYVTDDFRIFPEEDSIVYTGIGQWEGVGILDAYIAAAVKEYPNEVFKRGISYPPKGSMRDYFEYQSRLLFMKPTWKTDTIRVKGKPAYNEVSVEWTLVPIPRRERARFRLDTFINMHPERTMDEEYSFYKAYVQHLREIGEDDLADDEMGMYMGRYGKAAWRFGPL